MPISHDTIANVFDHLLKQATWTAPTNVYVALFTSDPGYDNATGVEVSGGSYARVQHQGAGDWIATVGSDLQYENNGTITFPTATANWGTVSHFALFDALTAGNYLAGGALTTAKYVSNGDVASFADATLKLSFT